MSDKDAIRRALNIAAEELPARPDPAMWRGMDRDARDAWRSDASAREGNASFAPPGTPERSANFQKWFGDSKARDKQGNPLRLYHITNKSFSRFTPGGEPNWARLKKQEDFLSGPATWLSPYPEHQPAAHNVGGGGGKFKEGANVMPVHARIERPLVIDSKAKKEAAKEKYGADSFGFPLSLSPKTRQMLIDDGYDGIFYAGHTATSQNKPYYDTNEIGSHPDKSEEIVALHAPGGSQIKSAIGNRGRFNPQDPDVNFSSGGNVNNKDARRALMIARKQHALLSRVANIYAGPGGGAYPGPGGGGYAGPGGGKYPGPSRLATGGKVEKLFPRSKDPKAPINYGYDRHTSDVPVEWLSRMPGNARRLKDDEYAELKRQLQTEGIRNPLTILVGKRSRTAKLGEGNHRLMIARELGYTHVPARVLVGDKYGSEHGAQADYSHDLIPEPDKYFSEDAKPSAVFKSLQAPQPRASGGKVPPFKLHSGAAKLIAQKGQAKATPQQYAAMPGIKPDELKYAKFDTLGSKSMPREEVAKHLRKNKVPVMETVLGGNKNNLEELAIQRATDWGDIRRRDQWFNLSESDRQFHRDGAQELMDYAATEDRPLDNSPRHQNYTLPGGTNYREVLLHLPDMKTPVVERNRALHAELEQLDAKNRERFRAYADAPKGEKEKISAAYVASQKRANEIQNEIAKNSSANIPEYKSSHWDEPNVLAHIRMSDRKGPSGEKVLHVEEVQSDWGQQGREHGFKTGADKRYNDWKADALKRAEQQLGSEPISDETKKASMQAFNELAHDYNPLAHFLGEKEHADKLWQENLAEQQRTPSGPYVDNTQKWTDLALKRVLHEAAHGGYDKVVFTPGAEQNKRWPGSAHGKYYDEIMPKRLQALAQQHDPKAKVQLHAHKLPGFAAPKGGVRENEIMDRLGIPRDQQAQYWAEQSPAERTAHFQNAYAVQDTGPALHSLDVTPQMRDSIKQNGFNQFKRGGDVTNRHQYNAGGRAGYADGGNPDDHPAWIPTRLITSKKHIIVPGEKHIVDLASLKQTPDVYAHNVDLVRSYPNMPLAVARLKSHDRVAEAFIDHVKNNLLALHDAVPDNIRQRSKLWYDGARAITDRWSQKYGVPDHSIAGALAALSPQKDWYQNVSLAERVLDAMRGNGGNFYKGYAFDRKMAKAFADRPSLNKPAYEGVRRLLNGRTLSDLDGLDLSPEAKAQAKALWIRMHDEAHNDPAHQIITPEGDTSHFVMTSKGAPAKVGWGSLTEIGKAILAIENADNPEALSQLMGEKHKVRNFYNNILAPRSPHGDVTIDTHAVAAGLLRPLSGNSLEVAHNFANYPGKDLPTARGTALTGIQGTYPLYAEAYRRAAAERGILPREMQSITWEAVRGLFPDTAKTVAHNNRVNEIWNEHRRGRISQNEAQQRIFGLTAPNGIPAPTWFVGGASGANEGDGSAAGQGALLEPPVRGAPAGTPDGRARGGASPTVPPRSGNSPASSVIDRALALVARL